MEKMLQNALKSIVPPLSFSRHKGMSGRVGVIGGSLEYTGAPYFAAISAMKAGADLSHIFCPEEAATVIKSYSPELIVHPLLSVKEPEALVCSNITPWFPRLHVLVIGPGLGRDPRVLSTVKVLINTAKEQEKDIVIDADGLFLITNEPEIVIGYSRTILTPNAAEFLRLYRKMFGSEPATDGDIRKQTKALAEKMGNLTILRKGQIDVVSNGKKVIECSEKGCPRRCGGQGDLLSGTIGLFSFWARQQEEQLEATFKLSPLILAAYGGCFLIRKCAEIAFSKHQRSMLAGDMVKEIPTVFQTYIESQPET